MQNTSQIAAATIDLGRSNLASNLFVAPTAHLLIPVVSVSQAAAMQASSVPRFAIRDFAANVQASLSALLADTKLTSIKLSDATTAEFSLSGAAYAMYAPVLNKIASPYRLEVSGTTVDEAALLQENPHVTYFSVSDTAAHVAAALSNLLVDKKLTSISLTDSVKPTLSLSAAMYESDTAILDKITSPYSLSVTGATVSAGARLQNDPRVSSFTIADKAANIQASLDSLNGLSNLKSISVTDSMTLSITFGQYQNDASALAKVHSAYLNVSGVTASSASSVWQDPRVIRETIADALSAIGSNLDNLEKLAKVGAITAINVTDSGHSLTLTQAQYAVDLDAIQLMHGNFTIGGTKATPPTPPAAPTNGLQINFVKEASMAGAPTAYVTALTTAASMLEAVIANNITLNIEVGWGIIAGQVIPSNTAEGATNGDLSQNFATVTNELKSNVTGPAASNLKLPASDPFGAVGYDVSGAQAKAWGLASATGSQIDGEIGVSSRGWSSSQYVGVILHEITHAMGRNSGWGGINEDTTPLDFFRYSAPGTLVTDGSVVDPAVNPKATGLQYFSIDGGKSVIADFDNSSDYGDWYANSLTAHDPMDAFAQASSNTLTTADIVELGAMGYKLTASATAVAANLASGSQLMSQAVSAVSRASNHTTFSAAASLPTKMLVSAQTYLILPHNRG